MQIVKAMGGLGNQMFAYAFALALRKRGREVAIDASWHERNAAHNGWELDRVFTLDIPLCSREDRDRLGDLSGQPWARLRRKFLGERASHFKESRQGYDPRFLEISSDAYFEGFWQSPRYHEAIEAEIEAAFRFPAELEPEGRACLDAAKRGIVIGVHVRRGDYVGSATMGNICDEDYYRLAIAALSEGIAEPILFFFSDDLDWCRRNLSEGRESVYVDWNRGADSWRDVRLMTLCDRLAIANSSFSWWGARLGRGSSRMIVAPSTWYGGKHPDNPDIGLPSWIRLGGKG